MEEKKYELTDETIDVNGHTLHRIKAIRDFDDVKVGELGGFIEKEYNLSHDNNAWISDNAKVSGNAWISDNAKVYGNAMVYGKSMVSGDAMVYDDAQVYGNAEVCDYTQIYGTAMVCDNAMVFDNAQVYGCSSIVDHSTVAGDSIICNANIRGYAKINQNGCIKLNDDYIIFDRFGSRLGTTTMFRCSDGIIRVSCGCFSGTLKEFRNKVGRTYGFNKHAKEYKAIIKVAKVHFNLI